MAPGIAPAISRKWDGERDHNICITTVYDSVSFQRGLGDSGHKVQLVKKECPSCKTTDRMVREVRVYPEDPTMVKYWCTLPTCEHYMGDGFGYAFRRARASEPMITE